MFKISKEDFIFEVKEELSCYDEIGREGAEKWVEGFNKWCLGRKKTPEKITLKDESDIFETADRYLEAVEEGKTAEYWKKFSL
ncbi:MAG: hypothetical protein LUD77_05355 [Clostridiales bacterium]|nr:hypothetical protein [Clostridiales bacterium]